MASETLDTLKIAVDADTRKLLREMARAGQAVEQTGRRMEKSMGGFSGSVGRATQMLTRLSGGLLGIGAIVSTMRAAMNATIEAEKATAKLDAVIRATGNTVGVTRVEMERLAETMARSTLFDDEAVREAEAALLVFKNVQGDVFRDAIRLSADLAALMGGDLSSAAEQLGKALAQPGENLRALKAAGVTFTEQEIKMLQAMAETGRAAEAQDIILQRLNGTIGGLAEQVGESGLTGATDRLKDSWEELLEKIGDILPFEELIGLLASFIETLNDASAATDQFIARRTVIGGKGGAVPINPGGLPPLLAPPGERGGGAPPSGATGIVPVPTAPPSNGRVSRPALPGVSDFARMRQDRSSGIREMAAEYAELRDAAQATFDQITDDWLQATGQQEEIQRRALDDQLTDLRDAREAGGLTEQQYLEGLSKLWQTHFAELDELEKQRVEDAKAAADEIERANREAAEAIERAFSGTLGEIRRQFQTLEFDAKAILQSIIGDMASQLLSVGLGSFGGGTGLFGILGGLIGGVNSNPFLAEGGPINGAAIVGERGPELFVPKSPGTIIPNNMLGQGGKPVVVNNHYSISPGVTPETAALVFREARKTEQRTIARIVKLQRDTGGGLV